MINASEAEDPQRYMVLKLGLIITVLIDKRVMDMCNSLREKSREAICFALITNYRSHDTQFLMLSLREGCLVQTQWLSILVPGINYIL